MSGEPSARAFIQRMRLLWKRQPIFRRRWFGGILLALLVEGVLHQGQQTPLGGILAGFENIAVDIVMRVNAHIGMHGHPDPTPLGIIDIDDETWRSNRWGGGRPILAPRGSEGLGGLMTYALRNEARYVILDIVIENSGDADPRLEKFIASLKPGAGQHIIFARTVEDPLGQTPWLAPGLPGSPLDPIIDAHPTTLHRAAPYFTMSPDGVVRDWKLWRVGCRGDPRAVRPPQDRWAVLPSVQLVVAVFEKERLLSLYHDPVMKELKLLLGLRAPEQNERDLLGEEGACYTEFPKQGIGGFPDQDQIVKRIDGLVENRLRRLDLLVGPSAGEKGRADLSSRIVFTMASPPLHDDVRTISALKAIGPAPIQQPEFTGGLLVIGQSFMLAGDRFETPVGRMSGPMLLINSVNSMQRFHALAPVGGWTERIVALFELVLIPLFLALAAFPLVLLGTIPILLAANYVLFIHGWWLDFSLPILAIGLHRIADHIIDWFRPEAEVRHATDTTINIAISRQER